MRLFIDECVSPHFAMRLNALPGFDAVHPLHLGRRGEPDHVVLARCIAEDRVIVTENAIDFRGLVGRADIHPGLIILPSVDRETAWSLLTTVIRHLQNLPTSPMDAMVNHVAQIDAGGAVTVQELVKSVDRSGPPKTRPRGR